MADEQTVTAEPTVTETAVETAPVQTTEAAPVTEQVAATQPTPAPVTNEPKFLGRFHTAEQLEAYAQGLEKSQARPAPTPQTTTQTTAPTVEQLKFSKAHWRTEAFKAQVAGDPDAYQKAAANIDWCDEQMYDARLAQEAKKWQGQGAAESLLKEGADLLKPYQAELVPGNPLYETAMTYFNQAKQAMESGVPFDQILSGLTVLAAAQKTGKTTAGATQKATANFADALNKAAKTAIVTGGGAAAKMDSGKMTAEKLANMSDEEFAKHEAQVLAQSKTVSWSRHRQF